MYHKYNNDNIKYKIGLYIRLSREDGDDMESESVSNQRSLLSGFLKANKLEDDSFRKIVDPSISSIFQNVVCKYGFKFRLFELHETVF